MKKIRAKSGTKLANENRRVPVITYTNAATDEIISRLKDTSIFDISTIHSFIWSLIKPFQKDIKKTYISFKEQKLADLEAKLTKAKPKSRKKYEEQKEGIVAEIEFAKSVDEFVYDPNGENLERNSLVRCCSGFSNSFLGSPCSHITPSAINTT